MKPGEKPTPEQIARARERAKMTQQQASALIYKQWRAWDRWEKGLRKMDPAYWELWQMKARLAQIEQTSSN